MRALGAQPHLRVLFVNARHGGLTRCRGSRFRICNEDGDTLRLRLSVVCTLPHTTMIATGKRMHHRRHREVTTCRLRSHVGRDRSDRCAGLANNRRQAVGIGLPAECHAHVFCLHAHGEDESESARNAALQYAWIVAIHGKLTRIAAAQHALPGG